MRNKTHTPGEQWLKMLIIDVLISCQDPKQIPLSCLGEMGGGLGGDDCSSLSEASPGPRTNCARFDLANSSLNVECSLMATSGGESTPSNWRALPLIRTRPNNLIHVQLELARGNERQFITLKDLGNH